MLLGSKPLMDMTVEEMQAAMEELRTSREALRNEAIKTKAANEAKGITGEPKQKRERKSKVLTEADNIAASILEMMRQDDGK